ncbi:NADH-quinone oxidoreductase subunit C [Streptomyces sp. DW26H14]|uniref:NADH-quinone oxidoreductase subunit C n=1 Tax=Streptomyces sp. DW26H14 TaxID=3435395 RepID=UPI00403D72B3
MTEAYDTLPGSVADTFGEGASAELSYGLLTVDVPAGRWLDALTAARSVLGCDYFDWLSAVDEGAEGFRVSARVFAVADRTVRALLVRTAVPHDAAELPSAVGVYAGAAWHERETHEMFGIAFGGHPNLTPLLLPENFEGHPLRKDFVLAARVVKAWPGAKDPGESASPRRRQMLPPGVPDPNEWGPHKGESPRTPARPAPGGPAGAPARAAEETPRRPRRTRSASEGSASQGPATDGRATGSSAGPAAGGPAAGGRGAAGGSGAAEPDGPAPRTPRRSRSASGGSASQRDQPRRDAPWHRPAPGDADTGPEQGAGPEGAGPEGAEPGQGTEAGRRDRDTGPDQRDQDTEAGRRDQGGPRERGGEDS